MPTLADRGSTLTFGFSPCPNDCFIFDPSVMIYTYMRDTKSQDNIQANDADEQKGQWLTECGLEQEHAKTAAWLSNFVVP